MTFAQRLQEMRKSAGLSQEELAERLGVSRQSVSKWELGQAYPETEKIIELSRMFGVSLDLLLKGEEPSSAPDQAAPRRRPAWLIALAIGAVVIVAVFALLFVSCSNYRYADHREEPASSESPTYPEETAPPEQSPVPSDDPVSTDPPETSTEPLPTIDPPPSIEVDPTYTEGAAPLDMAALREYYFDFAQTWRLDYVPVFERHQAPWDSTEYLFWAFAVNLDGWGEDKGTMTADYVDGMTERHFGILRGNLEHQSMFKCWNYENGVYTAVPQSILEQPLYFLTGYATWEENGIRYHRITLEYYNPSYLPTPEQEAALRLQVIDGSTADLTLLQRETFLYHMSATEPGVPVFDSHSIEYLS